MVAVAGLIDASYLAYAQLSIKPNVCVLGQWFNCDAVLTSAYSKIYGVPMSIFGSTWFAIAIILVLAQLYGRQLTKPLIAWGVLGLAGVLYLNYVELVLLKTICVYCLTAHVLGVAFLAATIIYARTNSSETQAPLSPSS